MIGGTMIRRFDGFRRMLRRAADGYTHPLRGAEPDGDLIAINRILAGLGGPPAPVRLSVALREADSLAILLLFLLTQPVPARLVLTGDVESHGGRVKQLVHLFGQVAVPMVTRGPALSFDDTVRSLTPVIVALRPVVGYDAEGEVAGVELEGAVSELALIQAPGEPLTLVISGEGLHEVTATIEQQREGWISYITG